MCYSVIHIEPIEPMLFGDNRLSRGGDDHLIEAMDPSPYTVFGAVGAHIARNMNVEGNYSNWAEVQKILGEFIDGDVYNGNDVFQLLGFTYMDQSGYPWFPLPRQVLMRRSGNKRNPSYSLYKVTSPQKPMRPSSLQIEKYLPAEIESDVELEEKDCFIDRNFLKDILSGNNIEEYREIKPKFSTDFFKEEFRTGLEMNNKTNVAEESYLFTRPYRRFKAGVSGQSMEWKSCGYTAWVKTIGLIHSEMVKDEISFFGGDRRRAQFSISSANENLPLKELLQAVCENVFSSKGFFAYCITPTPAKDIKKYKIENCIPKAAAIGKPIYMSGWAHEGTKNGAKNVQRPRRMIHALPPGTVLFYEWASGASDEEKKSLITKHWVGSLTNEYACFGFGRILLGVWK